LHLLYSLRCPTPCSHLLRCLLSFLQVKHPHPASTLFPYTTLFRSGRTTTLLEEGGDSSQRSRPFARRFHDQAPCPELGRETAARSEEHTSELQSRGQLVCRLLLEKKKKLRTGRELI